MKIIYGGRRSGKTTKLIEMSAKDGGYIVCHSKEECSRIFLVAHQLGLDIPLPITYDELISDSLCGKNVISYHIDNVEILLQHLCRGVLLKTITFTPFGSIEKLETPKYIMDEFKERFQNREEIDYPSDFSKLIK